MQKFLNRKGSVTVEATFVLPIFVSVVVCIAFIIKLIYVHEVMQHAISSAADEMASYSYLFEVSGVKDLQDEVRDGLEKSAGLVEKQKATVLNSLDLFQTASKDAVQNADSAIDAALEGNLDQTSDKALEITNQAAAARESIQNIAKVAGEIKKNPAKEIKSLLAIFGKDVFKEVKNEFFIALVKLHMGKYLAEENRRTANQRLLQFGIQGGWGGLNFDKSNFLKSSQEEDFDIILTYQIKVPVLFNLLPKFNMVQRATVRAWFDGGVVKPTPTPKPSLAPGQTPTSSPTATPGLGTQAIADVVKVLPEDLWALPKLQRGKQIERVLGRNQDEFAPIDILDGRTAVSMATHDIRRDSFKGSGFLNTLENEIKKLAEFSEYKKGSICISSEDYDLKEYHLVLPDCAILREQIQAIENAKQFALKKGIKMLVIVAKPS